MNFFKIRRKIYLISITVIVTVVLIVYILKDLSLEFVDKIAVPDIVVENINVNRVINGQQWWLKSPYVEHKDNVIYAKSLDIITVDSSSSDIRITAERGTLYKEKNDFTLFEATGVMTKQDGKEYNLTTGKADYKSETETWNFSDSVALSDDKTEVTGSVGVYNMVSGDMTLPKGGTIKWKD